MWLPQLNPWRSHTLAARPNKWSVPNAFYQCVYKGPDALLVPPLPIDPAVAVLSALGLTCTPKELGPMPPKPTKPAKPAKPAVDPSEAKEM